MIMSTQQNTIWSATPTPFLDNGELDQKSIERVVEQHLSLGVTGLFLAGTCGEGPFMPHDQHVELVSGMRQLAGSRLKLAMQVSDTSAARVRDNMKRAAGAGADAVVIAPPWLDRFANRDFMRRYFLEPIESAEIPVGIYVMKAAAGSPLDLTLWTELAAHPKVQLVKDSSGSAEYAAALAGVRRTRSDILLLTGNEFDTVSAIKAGYDGVLLGTGILIAGLIRKAIQAVLDGDGQAAADWQTRSNELLWDLFGRDIHLWLGGLKYALKHLGIFQSEFMHLAYTLNADDRKRIDAALARERAWVLPNK